MVSLVFPWFWLVLPWFCLRLLGFCLVFAWFSLRFGSLVSPGDQAGAPPGPRTPEKGGVLPGVRPRPAASHGRTACLVVASFLLACLPGRPCSPGGRRARNTADTRGGFKPGARPRPTAFHGGRALPDGRRRGRGAFAETPAPPAIFPKWKRGAREHKVCEHIRDCNFGLWGPCLTCFGYQTAFESINYVPNLFANTFVFDHDAKNVFKNILLCKTCAHIF